MPRTTSSLEALGAKLAESLDDPRLGKKRDVARTTSKTICEYFQSEGRLLVDHSGQISEVYIVDFDGAVVPIADSLDLRNLLDYATLNAAEQIYRRTVFDLQVCAIRNGKEVTLRRYAYQTPDAIYLSAGPTKLVIITVDGLRLEPNGTDDVWFTSDSVYPVWQPVDTPVSPLELPAFRAILAAPAEAPGYTESMQGVLVLIWIIAAIIGIRPLPLLVLLGQMGCGKTLIARAIIKFLCGFVADVQTLPSTLRDTQTVLTSAPCVVFDNMDGGPELWLADILAQTSTGGIVENRKLFTNGQTYRRAISASTCITSRTPQFAGRADIQDRLLPIFFGERRDEQRLDDAMLIDEVVRNRDGLMTWAAMLAAAMLQPSTQGGLPGRFQRFAMLAMRLCPDEGGEALQQAYNSARVAVADLHPLISAIIDFGKPIRGTAKEILAQLSNAGYDVNVGLSGRIFCSLIREHRALIRVLEDKRSKRGRYFHIESAARGDDGDDGVDCDNSFQYARSKENIESNVE